jgi:hypothetical protein
MVYIRYVLHGIHTRIYGSRIMSRYYVELKRNLKQKRSISFYMMAYNRTQVIDMFGDEYYVVAVDPTE